MTLPWRFVPLTLLVMCAVGMAGLIRRHGGRYGRSPVQLFRSGSTVQSIREIRIILLALVLVWQALAAAFALYVPLGTRLFAALPGPGTLVFLAGVSLVAAAITNMGASWQMGFNQDVPPAGLVTAGLFRFSRNPIYLGMVVALVGWMLLVPTLLSLIIVAGMALGVRRQALDEEGYLLRTYGAEFSAWAREVGRFVPWVGRLR